MNNRRLELHKMLVDILGSRNVYFQPPETIKMNHPCIVYGRDQHDSKYADDEMYSGTIGYLVTVMDSNPDSPVPGKLSRLPMCRWVRHYTADNLNHDVFSIYY